MGKREPINRLFWDSLVGDSYNEELRAQFDMCRLIRSQDLAFAVKFAYIEHLLRRTTEPQEFKTAVSTLPLRVQGTVNQVKNKESTYIGYSELSEGLREADMAVMRTPEARVCVYFATDAGLEYTEYEPPAESSTALCPVLHLISLKNIQVILYSKVMSFIDGFDPVTGEEKEHLIPPGVLQKAKNSLYSLGEDISIQLDTSWPEMKSGMAVFSIEDFMSDQEEVHLKEIVLQGHYRQSTLVLPRHWKDIQKELNKSRNTCGSDLCLLL